MSKCQGWRRYGGAFSFGPVEWRQCKSKAAVLLTFKQGKEKKKSMPACKKCWLEAIEHPDIKITEAKPL